MSTYQVGTNKPIKLKVSVSTVGHTVTSFYLNDPGNTGKFLTPPKSNSFSNTDNTSWRQINEGNAVNGRTIKIKTMLTFPSGVPDENTFNLQVEQAKRSYTVQLSGGSPTPAKFDFKTSSIFEPFPAAQFVSIISLT